jgi:hypothetical protein
VQGIGVTLLGDHVRAGKPVADGSTKEQEELDAGRSTQVPNGPDLAEPVPDMPETGRVRRRNGVEFRDTVRFVNRKKDPHEVEEERAIVAGKANTADRVRHPERRRVVPEELAILRAAVGYGLVDGQLDRRLPRKLNPLESNPKEGGEASGELVEGGVDVVRVSRPVEGEEQPASGEKCHPRVIRRKRLDGLEVDDRRAEARQHDELGDVVIS